MIYLYKHNPEGNSFTLSFDEDPQVQEGFGIGGSIVGKETENGIIYYKVVAERVTYADGQPDGLTIRLRMHAPGSQQYTWRTGASEHGYIGTEKDNENFEATIYFRVHDFNKTHTSFSWIIRGGVHGGSHDPRSSCIGMQVPYANLKAKVFKELDHPDYDFLTINRKFDYAIQENKWLAVKVVSFLEEQQKRTRNFLYLDTNPYNEDGSPRNDFHLYTEWNDIEGVSTGQYVKAALWAGWETTFRVDGWKSLDIAHFSIREVIPKKTFEEK
ncbi:MAG: hypothetical protein Q7S11_03120 [bacterium]|nr:hypothetical protein [bacterium]